MKACSTHVFSKLISSSEVWSSHSPFHPQKIESYSDAISTHSFDMLALTETLIPVNADNVTKYDIFPWATNFLHSHRLNTRVGGIYLISSYSIKLTFLKSGTHFSFEALTAQAFFPTQSLTNSVIYRPPSPSNFIHELTAHLYFLSSTFNHFIIVGNFNTPNCHELVLKS